MGTRRHSEVDEGHLGIEELASMLEQGLDEESRARVLSHLGAGCPVCGGTLREWVARPEGKTAPTDDLVTLTLRDWMKYQRLPKSKLSELPPLYGHWIGREIFGPLEFHRAVLERGRILVVEDPDQALEALGQLLDEIGGPGLEESDVPAVRDLRGLGLVILARAHLERLDHVACGEQLRRAESELKKGAGDQEIEASILETRAALLQAQGENYQALTLLEKAEGLLQDCEVPQRRSELLARRGVVLVQSGFAADGLNVLEQAHKSLPNPSYPRLCLEIRHFQAAAAVQLREFGKALRYLASVNVLYKRYDSLEPIATQGRWLLGFSYLAKGLPEKAEKPLGEALKRYHALGLWDGAAHAMTGLIVSYASQGKSEHITHLVAEYPRVLDSTPSFQLAVAELRRLVRLARTLKISAPLLERNLEMLDAGQDSESKPN